MTIGLNKDQNILRALAGKVREISELPEQRDRKKRLADLNSLQNDRPVVLAFPEGAWVELLPEKILQCENELFRKWEMQLRKTIYQWEVIKDDSPVESYFDIGWQIDYGDFGVEIPFTHVNNRGSYHWDPPLKDLKRDLAVLKFREPRVDRNITMKALEKAREIFNGVITPRIRGSLCWTNGLTCHAITLVGLENFMIWMVTEPEGMHQFMSWLRDEQIHFLDWCEAEGLLTLNNGYDYVGSGGWGYTGELPKSNSKKVLLSDIWGLSESQESVGISPGMFGEFIFPYQLPVIEKFGLSCYGCCEGIQDRLDYILRITNLRRISVAPWANQEKIAAKINGKYIFSRKPNPAEVCITFNEDLLRKDIRKTLEIAGSSSLEIILKDTHTVKNEPWRISKWVEIALAEVENFNS